ncbi:MAG TPA: site-specific integrase [Methylomirabilota bacterium]|nr:site-specific integrase [Methylomirabilota bacterium]
MRGFGRAYQRANGTWAIAYYVHGQEVRESVAKLVGKPPRQVLPRDAERALRQRLAEVQRGTFIEPTAAKATVDEILDAYLAHCRLKGSKAAGDIQSVVNHLRRAFGSDRVLAVTAARLEAWAAEQLSTGRARGTVQLRLSYLRAALNLARRQGRLTSVPPFPAIEVQNARQGFLERVEIERLLRHLDADHGDVVTFAYLTGWRRSESLSLAWPAVDRARGTLRLGDSKNGEGRLLPLRRQDGALNNLGALIERRWRTRAQNDRLIPWVFHRAGRPISRHTLWAAWTKATRAAGLAGKLFHDLRRTAARDLIAAGNDYKTAMDITGHKTMAVFHRYQIGDLQLAQRGLDRLEAYRRAPGAVVALREHGQNTDKHERDAAQVAGNAGHITRADRS